jgi:hypothetical protein
MKWFKHETNAHTNLKLQSVINKFGIEAYGYYWACVELVGLQGENFRIRAKKDWKIYLKKNLEIELVRQDAFLEEFANKGLIDKRAINKGDLFIPKLAERSDEYTNKLRRKSGQTPDNVLLEENRVEENKLEQIKTEENMTELAIALQPKNFFSSQNAQSMVINEFIRIGVPDKIAAREVDKFLNYWTESNGKKQRWQMEKVFDVEKRFRTWFGRVKEFQGKSLSKLAEIEL